MSRRVIFQSFADEVSTSQQPDHHYDEEEQQQIDVEEKEEKDDGEIELMRETARKELTMEQRRLRRRRKARGSIWWRYINVRLQLRVLVNSTRHMLVLVLGLIGIVGLWSFLVFGKPDSSSVWPDLDTRWGGLLTDSESMICEVPKMNSFTRQPANGFATVCYALVGWFILWMWFLDEKNSVTFESRFGNLPASLVVRRCWWSALLGSSMLLLSTLAWLRHATYSNAGKRLETTGYWCVLFAFSTCAVTRLVDPPRKLRTRALTTISKIISFLFIFATVAVDIAFGIRLESLRTPGVPEIVFGTLAGLALFSVVVYWRMHRMSIESEMWLLIFGLLIFVGGFLFAHYELGICTDGSLFAQPYAFWHVCNSLAALLFYFFLRSDLWTKGDGAELAPSIRPFHWAKRGCSALVDYSREVCKGARMDVRTEKKSPARITLLRQPAPVSTTGEDEQHQHEELPAIENEGSFQKRVVSRQVPSHLRSKKSVRSVATVWTPEIGFSKKQIRVAEAFCGIIITGFIVYVIYLALAQPK